MADSDRRPATARTARRRYLTILFSDLSDSTTLSGAIEPEHYLEVLDHLKDCSHAVVSRYQGTIVDFRGDGFLAVFGFPQPSEDDARRATEAALDLHEAIRRMPPLMPSSVPALALHSGIHSGLVLLVEGDPSPGSLSLIGEAPSVAARLSDAARRGEILISATTLGAESHFFHLRERGELTLQGKAEPVVTYQVLERAQVRTRYEARSQRGLTPFLGRAHALAALERGLHAAMRGRVQTVSVVAAAGVGKTRLVEEFLARAAAVPCWIHRGYCDSSFSAEPLQPFLHMLRSLCKVEAGGRGAVIPETLDALIAPVDPELAEHREPLRRALASVLPHKDADGTPRRAPASPTAALCDLYAALARTKPVVIFIDDWHWVDDATRQVLGTLRELPAGAILLLTASRELSPRDSGLLDTDVLNLTPLDTHEGSQAIRLLRPDADPFLVKQIQGLSGGNPLFIEELCHSVFHEASQSRSAGRADSGPAWLSTLIESRVARLPGHQADLVRQAAVIGTVFPTWLLEEISGSRDLRDTLDQLAQKDLIFRADGEGALRFKHGITRDVIYHSVGLADRQALHRRVAECLERQSGASGKGELLETLAYHYRQSADQEQAAHYAELAGDKAMTASALDRARSQYGEALAALEELGLQDARYRRWTTIAQRFGLACVYDPMRSQLGVFLRAVGHASARHDEDALARAEYWLGYISYGLGELSVAIHHCERARDHCARALNAARQAHNHAAASELEALAANVLATFGQARAAAGEHDEALRQLDQALDTKRRQRGGGRTSVSSAYTLACKASVLGDRGQFAEAHACFAEALEAVRDSHFAVKGSILAWQSAVYVWQGRWSDSLDAATRAMVIAERIESLYVLGMSHALIGYARWRLERTPEWVEAVVRATSWLESHDKRLFISIIHAWIAGAMVTLGRDNEARHYAARAIRRARQRDRLGESVAYRVLAMLPEEGRRPGRPERYLERAMTSARARGSAREVVVTLLDEARLHARRGAVDESAAALERASAGFRTLHMDWHAEQAQRMALHADNRRGDRGTTLDVF